MVSSSRVPFPGRFKNCLGYSLVPAPPAIITGIIMMKTPERKIPSYVALLAGSQHKFSDNFPGTAPEK